MTSPPGDGKDLKLSIGITYIRTAEQIFEYHSKSVGSSDIQIPQLQVAEKSRAESDSFLFLIYYVHFLQGPTQGASASNSSPTRSAQREPEQTRRTTAASLQLRESVSSDHLRCYPPCDAAGSGDAAGSSNGAAGSSDDAARGSGDARGGFASRSSYVPPHGGNTTRLFSLSDNSVFNGRGAYFTHFKCAHSHYNATLNVVPFQLLLVPSLLRGPFFLASRNALCDETKNGCPGNQLVWKWI